MWQIMLKLIGLELSVNLDKTNTPPQPNPTLGQTFSQLNHAGPPSNFQNIFPIIYQHELWYKGWHPPSSLRSGTLYVLQFPNFGPDLNHVRSSSNFQDIFLIIYLLDLWCQWWPRPPSLHSGTLNVLKNPKVGQI